MKKILFIILITLSIKGISQYSVTQPVGAANSLWLSKGGVGFDSSLVFKTNYADTSAANKSFVKNVPNSLIMAGGDIWKRNTTAVKWEIIAAGGGGNTYTSSNGITLASLNFKLGGALTGATTIVTDATKTMAFTGLQGGAYTDSLVGITSGGVLRQMNVSSAYNTIVLDTVTDINTFNKSSNYTLIVVKDSIRGGTFEKYSGNDIADAGMIFQDANGQKWKRQTDGTGVINARWYGVRNYVLGESGSYNDMWDEMRAAQRYIWNHKNNFTTLLIPNDKQNFGVIYLSKTDTLFNPIIIKGNGTYNNPLTTLEWASDTKGIYAPSLQEDGNSNTVELANLKLNQGNGGALFDSSAHMMDFKCVFNISNIKVLYCDGNGLNVDLTSPESADRSIISDCSFNFCNNGVYYSGYDANLIYSYNSEYVSCRRWGYWDNSFLGCKTTSAHFAFNGVVNYQAGSGASNCTVTYGGNYYVCRSDTGIIGKSPLLYPTLWRQITAMTATAWDTTTKYFSGGAAYISEPDAWSVIDGLPYAEGFQPPILLNTRSKVTNGDVACEVDGGIFEHVIFGADYHVGDLIIPSYNADYWGTQIPRFVVGADDAGDYLSTARFFTKSSIGAIYSAATFEGDGNQIYTRWKTGSGMVTYLGTNVNSMVLGNSINGHLVRIDSTGITPWDNSRDNLYSLGDSTSRWRNGYFATKVGIGLDHDTAAAHTLSVKGTLKFVTGNQGLNKVLTSNATGVADWATLGGGAIQATNGLTFSGDTVKLGGTLTDATTTINANNKALKFDSLSTINVNVRTGSGTQANVLSGSSTSTAIGAGGVNLINASASITTLKVGGSNLLNNSGGTTTLYATNPVVLATSTTTDIKANATDILKGGATSTAIWNSSVMHVMATGGKVGILNAAPDSALSVTGGFHATGGAKIEGLLPQSAANDSMMVVTPTTGKVGYRAIPSGSGAYLPLAGGTLTGQLINSTNGAASTSPSKLTGTWYTGGTATTTKPQLLIEPTGTTSTAWSTSGTGLGVNAASGFTGNLLDAQVGGSSKFNVNYAGTIMSATHVGGTNVADALSLQGTTGNGTSTAKAVKVLVGNNGASEAVTVLNNKRVGINQPSPDAAFRVTGTTGNADFRIDYNGGGDNYIDGGSLTNTLFIRSKLRLHGTLEWPTDNMYDIGDLAGTTRPRSGYFGTSINTASFAAGYVAKTATYTATISDYTVNCTANSFTVTLPTAVGITGRIYNIKNTGTGVITVATTSSQTIDASASGAITLNQWDNLQVQSNGANWIIL